MLRWLSVAVCGAIGCLWADSYRADRWGGNGVRWKAAHGDGVVRVVFSTEARPYRRLFVPPEGGERLPLIQYGGQTGYVAVPYWIISVGALTFAAISCLPRRRHLGDRCSQCNYDLTGNVSGRCPECGNPTRQMAKERT